MPGAAPSCAGHVSTLSQVEPILVDYCIGPVKMDLPLSKDQVIHLAKSLIVIVLIIVKTQINE